MKACARCFILITLSVTGTGLAIAQTSTEPGRAQGSTPSGVHEQNGISSESPATAQTFIQRASQDGMTEVRVASLAQKKSPSEDIRQFAAQMQQDHGKANSELESIAASKHIPVANSLDAEHQAMVTELSGKSGAAFDAAYASHMATAHQKAVALFQSATHSRDSDIANFASKTLPALERHKGMAQELVSKRKLTAAGAPGATS
jgi:putative membrane protein